MFNTTFSSRKSYLDGIGQKINNANSLKEALNISSLDYEIEKQKIYVQAPLRAIPDSYATIRKDNKEVMGIVGKNYSVLQNREAFDFLDSLVENGAKFELAGEYNNGRSTFVAVSADPYQIMGDDVENYILITNSFDGSTCINVLFTSIRVVCKNTLNMALKSSPNKISIRHSTDVQAKLTEAKKVLLANAGYKDGIIKASEELATTTFTEAQFVDMVTGKLLKLPEDASNTIVERFEIQLQQILNAYRQPDLANFDNTAYKAVQAIADFESHKPVFRDTKNNFTNFNTVVAGMPLLNTVYQMVRETV